MHAAERVRVFCRLRPYVPEPSPEQPEGTEEEHTFVTDHANTAAERSAAVKCVKVQKQHLSASSNVKSNNTSACSKQLTFFDSSHMSTKSALDFEFDACFDEDANQDEVYATAAKDLVQSVLDGYNGMMQYHNDPKHMDLYRVILIYIYIYMGEFPRPCFGRSLSFTVISQSASSDHPHPP